MPSVTEVRIHAVDVSCTACGWTAHLPGGYYRILDAHHAPVLHAVHDDLGTWIPREGPRRLR